MNAIWPALLTLVLGIATTLVNKKRFPTVDVLTIVACFLPLMILFPLDASSNYFLWLLFTLVCLFGATLLLLILLIARIMARHSPVTITLAVGTMIWSGWAAYYLATLSAESF